MFEWGKGARIWLSWILTRTFTALVSPPLTTTTPAKSAAAPLCLGASRHPLVGFDRAAAEPEANDRANTVQAVFGHRPSWYRS